MSKNVTPFNSACEREVQMMMSKAMCAYANMKDIESRDWNDPWFRHESQDISIARAESEYEATIRILAMFVKESLYEIQHIVISNCEEEFGIYTKGNRHAHRL